MCVFGSFGAAAMLSLRIRMASPGSLRFASSKATFTAKSAFAGSSELARFHASSAISGSPFALATCPRTNSAIAFARFSDSDVSCKSASAFRYSDGQASAYFGPGEIVASILFSAGNAGFGGSGFATAGPSYKSSAAGGRCVLATGSSAVFASDFFGADFGTERRDPAAVQNTANRNVLRSQRKFAGKRNLFMAR